MCCYFSLGKFCFTHLPLHFLDLKLDMKLLIGNQFLLIGALPHGPPKLGKGFCTLLALCRRRALQRTVAQAIKLTPGRQRIGLNEELVLVGLESRGAHRRVVGEERLHVGGDEDNGYRGGAVGSDYTLVGTDEVSVSV